MNLSDDEKITYLANLIAVSRVDGSVSPNETQAIEAAQKRIGARKTALEKADTIAQSEEFVPTAVGSFSVTKSRFFTNISECFNKAKNP